tara:strand:- start:271 stop:426 length:156 start_codon:yes stop_codon:yes gene_type:complete
MTQRLGFLGFLYLIAFGGGSFLHPLSLRPPPKAMKKTNDRKDHAILKPNLN